MKHTQTMSSGGVETALLASLVMLCDDLAELVQRRQPLLTPLIVEKLGQLSSAVNAYPSIFRDEICYYRVRLSSCRDLVERREFGATTYQVREIHHKLCRLKESRVGIRFQTGIRDISLDLPHSTVAVLDSLSADAAS